ncbi:MAG: hypothetical protein AAGA01_18305, partial [Cyanobacteria bacterium P01_E01_bin.43]
RPYPDRLGICYFYEGEIQTTLEPCVIGSGYGRAAVGQLHPRMLAAIALAARVSFITDCIVYHLL